MRAWAARAKVPGPIHYDGLNRHTGRDDQDDGSGLTLAAAPSHGIRPNVRNIEMDLCSGPCAGGATGFLLRAWSPVAPRYRPCPARMRASGVSYKRRCKCRRVAATDDEGQFIPPGKRMTRG